MAPSPWRHKQLPYCLSRAPGLMFEVKLFFISFLALNASDTKVARAGKLKLYQHSGQLELGSAP